MKRKVSNFRDVISERKAHQIPRPTKEKVARLVDLAQAGDLEARNILLEAHYDLIWKLARQVGAYSGKSTFTLDDLFQEGCLEFFEALNGYSKLHLGKNGKPKDFLAYVDWRVRLRLIDLVLQKGFQIHQSFARVTRQLKLQKRLKALEQALGRAVSPADLAKELATSEAVIVDNLAEKIDSTVGMGDKLSNDHEFTYHDVLFDVDADDFVKQLENKNLAQYLLQFLASPFYAQEREVLATYLDLFGQEVFATVSFGMIGERFGRSGEWARRKFKKALAVIRQKNKAELRVEGL